MKISIKTDYAIHSLMLLAKKNKEMSVEELAEIQNISKTYLAKVMQKLSSVDIVKSSEGKGGGYSLAVPPENINFSDIVILYENKDNIYDCVDQKRNCKIRDRCKIHSIFNKSYNKMLKDLERFSIKDILDPEIKKGDDSFVLVKND